MKNLKEKNITNKKKNNNVKTEKKENLFKAVRKELKKVTWPSKKDVLKYSVATLVFCIVLMVFFQLLDLGLSVIKGVFN